MTYSDHFLDALGAWQNGWQRKPALRRVIAAALLREVAHLPRHVREHDGAPLFRKRNLYRSEDQLELAPLFLEGVLDEGSATSWSTSEAYLEHEFGEAFDDMEPTSAAGAIFRHVPGDKEVVLNIPRLWRDSDFVRAAESYRQRGGTGSQAIFNFAGARSQYEIVLRAPLRAAEIHRLARATSYESLYATVGADSDATKDALDAMLSAAAIVPHEARFISAEATRRVVDKVVGNIRNRIAALLAEHTPTRPAERRARLGDAFELGRRAALPHAKFLGWRRLRGRGGLMEGRWSDGTVAYHGRFGRCWRPLTRPYPQV